jgi:predicted transcriptional regulator
MSNKHLKRLSAAVIRLLRPLVRILLRNGVSYKTFSDLAKWVYVDVASKEFGIKGRKQSTSRVSVVTGLSRKEVVRVRKLTRPDDSSSAEKYNRAARVIAAWRREDIFLDAKGKPAPLPMTGPGATFSELVKNFSGDIPVRAILDELIHIGAVKQLENGTVCLITRAYIPKSSEAGKLHILGTDVGHLISTIDHNLRPGTIGPFFQRKVAYNNLPDKILPEFRKLSAKKSQKLLENMDRLLAQHDRDVTPSVKGTGRNRAELGIYYFEEPYSNGEI